MGALSLNLWVWVVVSSSTIVLTQVGHIQGHPIPLTQPLSMLVSGSLLLASKEDPTSTLSAVPIIEGEMLTDHSDHQGKWDVGAGRVGAWLGRTVGYSETTVGGYSLSYTLTGTETQQPGVSAMPGKGGESLSLDSRSQPQLLAGEDP